MVFELLLFSKPLSAKSICFYGWSYSVFTHIYTWIYTTGLSKIYFWQHYFCYKFSLRGIFCVFKMQHCHVSINAERIGCVVVKLFVFFSFILFTGFIGFYLSHGRISLGHPNSSVPKIGIIHSILCILNSLQVLKKPLPVVYFHSHYSNNLKMF